MTRAAIMQPTFLPWLGYFALLDAVDTFVFLDDVQLTRRSWQVRNRVAGPDGECLLSLDVAGKPSRPRIDEARLAMDAGRRRKLLARAASVLSRAPHGGLVNAMLREGFDVAGDDLSALNVHLIQAIAIRTGIDTVCLRASTLGLSGAKRSERLLALCRTVGARTYLSPPGSLDYLAADDAFTGSGIELRFAAYEHPVYPRGTLPFVPHLAAIDALAWVGPDEFLSLVRSGVREPVTLNDAVASRAEAV